MMMLMYGRGRNGRTEDQMRNQLKAESRNGEIYVPIAVAAIPLGLFLLLGFIFRATTEIGKEPPKFFVIALLVVQFSGMIAMAVVFLLRYDAVTTELRQRTDDCPPALRKFCLMASLGCLLVFDVVTNVAATFGTTFLFVGSIPVFVAYIVFNRLAFAGLKASDPSSGVK